MSFQTIVDIHQKLTINNRRTVGQQVSRGGQVRVAEYLTAVPWVFTVVPHNYLYYPTAREIIQTIDNYDRELSANITFNTPQLEWFTKMQGTATAATLAVTPAANALTVTLSSNGTYKAGDFIQFGGYTYKVTEDSLGTTVRIHRPVIGSPTAGATVTLGKNVTFNVVAEVCPTYSLTPMTNGAFVEWDQPFVFREYIV